MSSISNTQLEQQSQLDFTSRVQNILLGINYWSLALLGIITSDPQQRLLLPRLCVSALHLVIGGLFLLRQKHRIIASWKDWLPCLPSFVICGFAWKMAQDSPSWPWYAQVIFLFGTFWTITSFCYLGRSFAIFPSLRTIKINGPYRVMRHPAYFGELLMVLGSCLTAASLTAAIAFLIATVTIVWRLLIEEKFLSQSEEYQTYQQNVSWKMIPGVW